MDLVEKYLGEAMTKDQYRDMLVNTQKVAQKAERDYKKFVSIMKTKAVMDHAGEIQKLVKGFQAITYGTIFDYPLRSGGFGDFLVDAERKGMYELAAKEIKDMQKRIDNFEKWRKTSPSQRSMF
jgi:hypothetical protein